MKDSNFKTPMEWNLKFHFHLIMQESIIKYKKKNILKAQIDLI